MHPAVLAALNIRDPLILALIIAWILTVVLHEFAHGLVAHWGGDYTIAERGGLSLNPLQYIHPVNSLILPALFLMMGGIPLPGGVTYVRDDLLRNKWWQSAVSLAGPAMNFLIFVILAAAIHPKVGWVDLKAPTSEWTSAQRLVTTLAFLEIFSVLLNLLPLPPLDGFQAIKPLLGVDLQRKLSHAGTMNGLMMVSFVVIIFSPIQRFVAEYALRAFGLLGFDANETYRIGQMFSQTIRGE